MTIRELMEELENFGDHLEVRLVIPAQPEDRAYSLQAVEFDAQDSVVDLVGEEEP